MHVPALRQSDAWEHIHAPDCPLIVEARSAVPFASAAETLLGDAPFGRRSAGTIEQALAEYADLAPILRQDIGQLAHRFASLMATSRIRIRLEAITGNACKKVHADYTDLRLITTYAGPGSEYVPFGRPAEEAHLQQIATGHIGLFKGKLFAADHTPCFHRSPRIEGTGKARLVLVIDTPDREQKA
jgi:hypothetical protein